MCVCTGYIAPVATAETTRSQIRAEHCEKSRNMAVIHRTIPSRWHRSLSHEYARISSHLLSLSLLLPLPHVKLTAMCADIVIQVPIGMQLERAYGWWRVAIIYVLSGAALSSFILSLSPDALRCGWQPAEHHVSASFAQRYFPSSMWKIIFSSGSSTPCALTLCKVGASSSVYGWMSVYFVDLLANWRFYRYSLLLLPLCI